MSFFRGSGYQITLFEGTVQMKVDDLVQPIEKVEVTPTYMGCLVARDVTPVAVGHQPRAELSSLQNRVFYFLL